MTQPAPATPIADLSYRGYDGPLETRVLRFWTVALATIRTARRKVMFWIWAILSSLSYLFAIILLFFTTTLSEQVGRGAAELGWTQWFVTSIPWSILFILAVTIVVGSGSIAADNRANALLVYLSKPITKSDYIVGKWIGLFTVLFLVAFLPALVLYLYCLLSFRAEGFLTKDPLLIGRIVLMSATIAALHTSLMLGFSAWSRSPLMAGALYAGFYFLGVIVAPIVSLIMARGEFMSRTAVTIRSLAIPGLLEGLSYHIYGVDATPRFGPPEAQQGLPEVPLPHLWPLVATVLALIVLGTLLARARIRAVEVVRG